MVLLDQFNSIRGADGVPESVGGEDDALGGVVVEVVHTHVGVW